MIIRDLIKIYYSQVITLDKVSDASVVSTNVRDITCTVHDVNILGSNPDQVEMRSTFVYVVTEPQNISSLYVSLSESPCMFTSDIFFDNVAVHLF